MDCCYFVVCSEHPEPYKTSALVIPANAAAAAVRELGGERNIPGKSGMNLWIWARLDLFLKSVTPVPGSPPSLPQRTPESFQIADDRGSKIFSTNNASIITSEGRKETYMISPPPSIRSCRLRGSRSSREPVQDRQVFGMVRRLEGFCHWIYQWAETLDEE